MENFYFGAYSCQRCKKEYTVNDPTTWDRCTPEFCHSCTSYLSKQYALVPDPEPTH